MKRMEALHIHEDDLIEKFILGSGSGGQKINKTSSCVYIKYMTTGIQVKCQRMRSREANRYIALSELCDKIEEKSTAVEQKKIHLLEKLRRQKRRRTPGQKEKMLEGKRQRAQTKTLRSKIKGDD